MTPEVIRTVNEDIRPLCEELRRLSARCQAFELKWFGGMNVVVPNDNTIVNDGRESEGVSRLTGSDINNVAGLLINLNTLLSASGIPSTIQKPCIQVEI